MQVQFLLHSLPCTHAKHYAVKEDQVCTLFVVSPLSCSGYRNWWNVNLIFHKAPQEKLREVKYGEHRDQEGDLPRPIHCSGNCLFKNVVTLLWVCGDALSC
jgi:hypothetical protein